MVKEKMATGLPESMDFEMTILNCPFCIAGKLTQDPYPKRGKYYQPDKPEAVKVGDEVVSDSFGSIRNASRYGSCHIVEFIDVASRFGFMFGIVTLDQIPAKYFIVRNILSTQRGVNIKKLRTDGHGSYTSNEMKKTLVADGTIHIIRSPYCPNQNAIAELRVQTIVEMARTMLIHSCLPAYVWEDAVLHANYIRNRVSTRAHYVERLHMKHFGTENLICSG